MTTESDRTVGQALAEALLKAASGNSHASAAPAVVLWPDKEGAWAAVLPALNELIPSLCSLGPFDEGRRSGPAIWIKCAVAGALPQPIFKDVPIIYMPGVSRAELRAIESCARHLQPLAELQFRGVFWSQANAKDWTVTAFLSSRNGGLGLDVAQDKATQGALNQALAAGILLDRRVEEFKGRQVNAEWLHSLMAPNPTRDLLAWMNDPAAMRDQWSAVRWDIFVARCVADFSFDPVADGVLAAAELLAKGVGKWGAVTELYRDSHGSFPRVFDLLVQVQPPQLGLFPDMAGLAGYPQANEARESALRYALSACAPMDATQARVAILAAEKEHAVRRTWMWSRIGRAPLAMALGHLARVAELSTALPTGSDPAQLAESYRQTGWQVDAEAMAALATVHAKADVEAVSAALRAVYLPWLEEAARRLQDAAKAVGGLPQLPDAAAPGGDGAGVCTVFVDGLRYDAAVRLKQRLAGLGTASLSARWTSLPSVTASGKAWCSPVAPLVSGSGDDTEFEPGVAADGKPLSGHNFRKLLGENGIQALESHEAGDAKGRAWTESGNLDHYGHAHGIRLARDLDNQLDQVVERVAELAEAGWRRIRVVTDHGWLLMPGGLPKTELAKHQAETRWGRCAVLKDSAQGASLTFGWDWCKDVQVAYAPGVSCFKAGEEYAHGGISLQECLVPVIDLELAGVAAAQVQVSIKSVSWKGLRCVVEVESAAAGLVADIRTKPALAISSLVASTKPVEAGRASLAVADDEHIGMAAVVVVIGPGGEVLQKAATTVGG